MAHHRDRALENAQGISSAQIDQLWQTYLHSPDGPDTVAQNSPSGTLPFTPSVTDSKEIADMRAVMDHDYTQTYNDGVIASGQIPEEYKDVDLTQIERMSGVDYHPHDTRTWPISGLPQGVELPAGFSRHGHKGAVFDTWYGDQKILGEIEDAQKVDLSSIFNFDPQKVAQAPISQSGQYNENSDIHAIEAAADSASTPMGKLDAELAEADKILAVYDKDWGPDQRALATHTTQQAGPFDNPAKSDYDNIKDDRDLSREPLDKTTLLNDIVRAEALPQDEYGSSSSGNSDWYDGRSLRSYYENYNYNGVLDDNDITAKGSAPGQSETGAPFLTEINSASDVYPDPRSYLPQEVKATDKLTERYFNQENELYTATGKDQLSQQPGASHHHGLMLLAAGPQDLSDIDSYDSYREDLLHGASPDQLNADLQNIDKAQHAASYLSGTNSRIFKNLELVDADFNSMEDLKTHTVTGASTNPDGKTGSPYDTTLTVNWGDGSPSQSYTVPNATYNAVLGDYDKWGTGSTDLNHQGYSEAINIDGTPQDISGENLQEPYIAGVGSDRQGITTIEGLKTFLTSEKEEYKGVSELATGLRAQKDLATHNEEGQRISSGGGGHHRGLSSSRTDDGGQSKHHLLGAGRDDQPMLPQQDVGNIQNGDKQVAQDLLPAEKYYNQKLETDQNTLSDLETAQKIKIAQGEFNRDKDMLGDEWQGYYHDTGQAYEGKNTQNCFAQGTMIVTRKGEKAVERLTPGDEILTREGTFEPVVSVLSDLIIFNQHKAKQDFPVCIEKDALAPNVPSRSLYVSGGHGIAFDVQLSSSGKNKRILVPARVLINNGTIYRKPVRAVKFYHVSLRRHHVIKAHNMWSESYFDAGKERPGVMVKALKYIRTCLGLSIAKPLEVAPRYQSGRYVRQIKQSIDQRANMLAHSHYESVREA